MTALLIGLGSFALHAVITLLWLRRPGRLSPVARHAASALSTHAVGVALAADLIGPFPYWPAAAVSGFLAVCWLFAFSAVYKSVSLRILARLNSTPGHASGIDSITEEFVRQEFEGRVAVLVKMGCAEFVDDGYAATEKGRSTARRITMVQRVCGIVGSGMYGDSASDRREPAARSSCRQPTDAGCTPGITRPVP